MTILWQSTVTLWSGLSLAALIAMLAWVLATLAMPILPWIWDEQVVRWGTTVVVVLQALAVVTILASAWGWGHTAWVALAVMVMGWGVEFLGSRTGFPFGRYHYTQRLQPQLGHVPLLIPVAWLMMLPPAWAVADLIVGDCILGADACPMSHGCTLVALGALAFTAWDFFLDPQMVAWRLWVWERRDGYFGIPWTNYLGWALSAGVMTAVITILQPGPLPAGPLAIVYALTWLLETMGLGVFWRQPGPALCGFVGMGGMLLWAWLANR